MNLFVIVGLAISISIAVGGFMIMAGIGDEPGTRSSHSETTPTGGGLAIIAALGVVISILFLNTSLLENSNVILTSKSAQVLALIWAVGFLGLMDDILDLAAGFKFVFLGIISVAAIWALGPVTRLPFSGGSVPLPEWLAWSGSVFWVFAVMNVVNFMDGSNGLMLVVMSMASFFMASIAVQVGAFEPFLILIIMTGAIIGLLVYNLRIKASIFSGDVGALSIGFTYAVCVVWISNDSELANPTYIGPVLILPFIADTFFTMFRRAKNGERLMQAHRSHLYQRLIAGGKSHLAVATYYGLSVVALMYYTHFAIETGFFQYINFPILPALVLSSIYMLLGRRFN